MKIHLTQQDKNKIQARYNNKCIEYNKLTKEELEPLFKLKMSSTDKVALADIFQYKIQQAFLEERKRAAKEEVKSKKEEIITHDGAEIKQED